MTFLFELGCCLIAVGAGLFIVSQDSYSYFRYLSMFVTGFGTALVVTQ